jgi:hypothetical protein
MARPSPQEISEKWSRRMAQAGPDYQAGINRVTEAPGAAAARNVQGYQQGVMDAITNGKWQQNVGAVPLEDWRQAALTKGSQRLTTGAAQAVGKVAAAHERIGPMLDRAASKIANMPRATVADRIQRMVAHATEMNAAANSGRRRR